jgi:hypothetical protein
MTEARFPGRASIAALPPEFKQAALAAGGLVVSLFLPWYEKNAFFSPSGGSPQLRKESLSAFEVISFVEAAVVLVAAGVLFLAYARAQRRPFHLPGGDGTVIMAAGGWASLLLVWRLFDKPDVEGAAAAATVGIKWGWFVALVFAVLIAVSGARLRAAHRPEPPNPAAEDPWEQPVQRRRRDPERDRPVVETAVTEVLRDRPLWEGEPPAPPPARRRPDPEPTREPDPEPPTHHSTSQDRLF